MTLPRILPASCTTFDFLTFRGRKIRQILNRVQLTAGNGIVVRDQNYRVLSVNKFFQHQFGLASTPRPGLQIEAYLNLEAAQAIALLDSEVLLTHQTSMILLPEGSSATNQRAIYRVTTTPVYSSKGALQGLISVFVDNSELVLAEKVSAAYQKRYNCLFESITTAAAVLRVGFTNTGVMDLRMLESNGPFKELIGSQEMPIHRSALEVWPSFRNSVLLGNIAKLMAGGPAIKHEIFSSIIGRRLSLDFSRFGDDAVLLLMHDVTELRQAEQHILDLNLKLRGSQYKQQKRIESLLDDANEFMSVCVEKIDESIAVLSELTGSLSNDDLKTTQRITRDVQDVSEKVLRYIGVGLLPTEIKLTDMNKLINDLYVEFRQAYPSVKFVENDLPQIVVPRDGLRSIFRNLLEYLVHELAGQPSDLEFQVGITSEALASWLWVEFRGVPFPACFDPVGDETAVIANWENERSLQLAAVRRILINHDYALWVSRIPEGGVRFLFRDQAYI